MRHVLLSSRLPALVIATSCLAAAAPATAQATAPATGQSGEEPENRRIVTFADLTASVGYSSSPAFGSRNESSAFGRLSFLGFHAWNDERGGTSVSGFVEDTTYVRGGYGSKVIFRVNARTDRAVSEKVKVFGELAASGDVAGQLSNRFTSPPVVTPPPDTNPPPATNPEVVNLSGRQYFINGQVGASISTSALSSVSVTAGAAHTFFTGGSQAADYTSYQGSLGYSHQLSERSSIGSTLYLQRQDYRGSDYSNVVNPVVTYRTQLASDISANGSIGLLAIYVHRAGESSHSYSPSFFGSVCKSGERSSFCANVSRSAQAPITLKKEQATRSAAITTNLGLSYSRTIGQGETIRALVTATRSSSLSIAGDERLRTTYVTGLVGYDRKIRNRLFAGVSVGARKVFQNGADPRADFNGNFYLRYRLGDLL